MQKKKVKASKKVPKGTKIKLGKRKQLRETGWISAIVQPASKFWKRYFNKKVRKGEVHKKSNWLEWS